MLLILLLFINEYDRSTALPDTAFPEILNLLLKVLSLIILIILTFSFLSVILAYTLCKKKEAKSAVVDIRFSYPDEYADNRVVCIVNCEAAAPLFGSVKAHPVYDKAYAAPKFALHSAPRNKKKNQKKTKLTGKAILYPPETRHYQLKSISLCFEDVLRLFSLRRTFYPDEGFSALPGHENIAPIELVPMQSKEQLMRTDVIRRQEGEWLHFKDFEPSDDIRRIVWQMYARNKELVVRMPETMNMYASQIDVYVSFYNAYLDTLDLVGKKFSCIFLNAYKRMIWSLLQSLETSGEMSVNYVPDQIVGDFSSPELSENLSKLVSVHWNRSHKPVDYFKLGPASLCCISPLIPADELQQTVHFASPNTTFVYVDLRKSLTAKGLPGLLKDIFTSPDEAAGEIAQWKWWLSPMRARLAKNDKEIKALFHSSEVKWHEI
jgi:hypothetical protein